MTTPAEAAAVASALLYLVLAIRENRWCWPAGIASSLLYLLVFYRAGLFMQAGLQVFYAGMGVYGWWAWRPSADGAPALIRRWPLARHGLAVAGVAVATAACGAALTYYGASAAPYTDAFVTVGALLATGMTVAKLLENWLYWFVIDAVTLVLTVATGLYATAGLFAVYLVLVVLGWRRWLASELAANPGRVRW